MQTAAVGAQRAVLAHHSGVQMRRLAVQAFVRLQILTLSRVELRTLLGMLSRRRALLYRVRLRTVCRRVIAAEVIALRRLIPLLCCRITLGITRT